MRGLWSDLELQRGLAADWTFSPGEAARMPLGLDSQAHT